MKRLTIPIISFACCLFFITNAKAQATRTWVSGDGDDANPCSRSAPCKTFAGAISKTTAGGEISTLDPGGFGAVTITKAMTLNGDGNLASISAAGTNAIIVNAGSNDVVLIRGISLQGGGTGLDGIKVLAAGSVIVENCSMVGFTQHNIELTLAAASNLSVKNTSMTGGASGVKIATSSGRVNATLDRLSITGAGNGVDALTGFTSISNSQIAYSTGYALYAEGGTISAESNMLHANSVAAQVQTGSILSLSNNDIFDNLTGYGCGGGTLATAGNNKKANNTGGLVPVCSPNGTVVVQ